ncbi:MAG: hypothetical protein IIV71_06330, partial [Bacteroidaceae bacterium]|nr:hypothetical protein [Bacteroidaceae bacterium]
SSPCPSALEYCERKTHSEKKISEASPRTFRKANESKIYRIDNVPIKNNAIFYRINDSSIKTKTIFYRINNVSIKIDVIFYRINDVPLKTKAIFYRINDVSIKNGYNYLKTTLEHRNTY